MIRRCTTFSLSPARDLSPSSTQPLEWISTGENPAFEIELDGGRLAIPTGWVYIESKMVRRGVRLVAQLHVDTGAGFSSAEIFPIPATRVGIVKHVVRIPRGARGMRLVPFQGEGTVRIDYFRITKISRAEKFVRMTEWVMGDLIKFKNTNQASTYNLHWWRLLTDLEGAYADCANLRFHSSPPEYSSYIRQFDTLHQRDIDAIKRHVAVLENKPLISIVFPVRDESVEDLKLSIRSILSQVYECWQLCVAVDAKASEMVVSYLKSLSLSEPRISLHFEDFDGRQSAVLNGALENVVGEFSIIVYPGNSISMHSLYFIALEINLSVRTNVIYSDSDEINEQGVRINPDFKSDWNPDLFLSQDMISGAVAYRTGLLRAIGGARTEFEGAHDYDLTLRCVANCEPDQIVHIARVLHHRRGQKNACPVEVGAKISADPVRMRALLSHLKDRRGIEVCQGKLEGTFRVKYPLPESLPMVSLIIPTRDGGELLRKCVDSVLNSTDYRNIEIIIVDNQSTAEDTISYLRSLETIPGVRVLRYDFPFNYSAINNFAVGYATGEILCFLNDDVEASHPDWLSEMVSHALRPEIGVVGAKLLYADNFVQHAGVVIGIGGFAGHAHKLYPATHPGRSGRALLTQSLSAVTGACLAMRSEIFREIGGFDEENLPVAFNDVDLCLRVGERGYRILWTPHAVLYHYESYSRGDDQASAEKRARFNREKNFMVERWNVSNYVDPYYNPNLTLDREDFSISNFPRIENAWNEFVDI